MKNFGHKNERKSLLKFYIPEIEIALDLGILETLILGHGSLEKKGRDFYTLSFIL